ncbi:MAG TPA: extensin family protein [Microvirga sp.]|jgi:hypothetical protein|nr:extensin family protein [Microvirga sp.]
MRRGLVAFGALTLVGLGLTGCGLFRFEQREPWRLQAEEACLAARQVQPSAYMSRSSKIEGPGACGVDYPFKVAAFSSGSVSVGKQVTLACPIIPRIDIWLDEVVKPAANLYFGVPVVDLRAGSYSCRPQNNRRGAKLSEHSFGNALDIMAFHLADGREVTVLKGWRGNPREQDFLREVFVGACRYFATVLGPGADMFHYDHFHIDLARHDPRGERTICKPILKFMPRLDRAPTAGERLPATAAAEIPLDIEEDAPGEGRPMAGGGAPPNAPSDLPPARSYPPSGPFYPPAPVQASPMPPLRPPVANVAPPPQTLPATRFPEPYRAPLYNRPPVAGQPPQLLNGHGIY